MAISFKCTEEAKTHIPEDMRICLEQDAHAAGCTFAEYLRDMIYISKTGMTFGEHVADHRRAVILGTGPQQGNSAPRNAVMRKCNADGYAA